MREFSIRNLYRQPTSLDEDYSTIIANLDSQEKLLVDGFSINNAYHAFESWLDCTIAKTPPPVNLQALRIGLFETRNGCPMCLSGYTNYDPYQSGWSCDDDWLPDGRYRAEINLSRLWKRFMQAEKEAWQIILVMVIAMVKHYFAKNTNLFKTSTGIQSIYVFVGFADGDLFQIFTPMEPE